MSRPRGAGIVTWTLDLLAKLNQSDIVLQRFHSPARYEPHHRKGGRFLGKGAPLRALIDGELDRLGAHDCYTVDLDCYTMRASAAALRALIGAVKIHV